MNKINFKREYNSPNSPTRNIIKPFNGLPFLDIPSIVTTLDLLTNGVDSLPSQLKAKIKEFIQYFRNFWLNNIQIWNHYDSAAPRTTNSVEGWHSKLNKKFNKAHPNVYSLMEILKKEVNEVNIKIMSWAAGHSIKKPALKYRKVNEMLRNLTELYKNGSVTALELVKGACYLYQ